MELKELLGEELYKQVQEKLGDKKLIVNDGSYIPKTKFDEKNEELKATKAEMDKLQDNLKTVTKDLEGHEKIKADLEKVNADFEQFKSDSEKRVANLQKTKALENHLVKAGASPDAVDLLLKEFDLDKVVLDSKDNVVDWDKHITPVKDSRKSLFAQTTHQGSNPASPPPTPEGGTSIKSQYQKAVKEGRTLDAIKLKQEAYSKGEII